MEYNDDSQESDETIQQSARSQDTERLSITAAPLSAVLHRLGLRPPTRSDEMQAHELLVTALTDEQVAVRTAAIQALVKQGRAIPIKSLLAIVQHDPAWSVRAMATLALRGGGDQVPIAPLLLALHDEDEAVRAAVVRVLGSMGERVPLQALQNALYDASWTVREAAMLTLEELEYSVPATVELASLYPDTSTPPLPLTPTEVNFLHHEGHQKIQAHEPEVHGLNRQHQSTHTGESSHNVAPPASRRHQHPFLANRRITNRRISRRAVMVGVATVIVAGNSVAWSLLLRSLHDRQNPQQTVTGNKSESISFYGPGYCALDAQGNLYVMDQDLQNTRARILKLSPTGKVLTEWHFQTGTQPACLAIDERGDPYVSVQGTKSVYQLSPNGNLFLKWRLTGAQPTGLAFDKQGNLYLASYDNDTIQKYSSVGKLLATWGGPGSNPGQFYNPTAIAVDAQGHIYVADQSNNRIQKLAPTGNPITAWGTSGNGPGQFLQIGAVALDSQGNVYTTDGSSGLVQEFSSIGKLLGSWGTTDVGTVRFGVPRGVAVDAQGNIYVSSATVTGATFITVLSPTGKVLAIWR